MDSLVTTDWLANEIGASDLRIVDASKHLSDTGRNARAEYEAGHIPGAINIPRGVLEFKLSNDPALCARELNIVLYCKTSGRAALAACSLQAMGYRQVQSLAGGFDAWSAAGKAQVAANLPNFE